MSKSLLIFSQRVNNEGKCSLKLPTSINNMRNVELHSITFERLYYTVMENINDRITIEDENSNIIDEIISEGNYTLSTLASAIESKLGGDYTVTAPDSLKQKYIITNDLGNQFKFNDTTTITDTLGFEIQNDTLEITKTAQNIYNLNYDSNIFILSNEFRADGEGSCFNGRFENILAMLPIQNNFGSFFEITFPEKYLVSSYINCLTELNFKLKVSNNKVIPANGGKITMKFRY